MLKLQRLPFSARNARFKDDVGELNRPAINDTMRFRVPI